MFTRGSFMTVTPGGSSNTSGTIQPWPVTHRGVISDTHHQTNINQCQTKENQPTPSGDNFSEINPFLHLFLTL
jgi:hypothetical protein